MAKPVIRPSEPEGMFNDGEMVIDYDDTKPVYQKIELTGRLRSVLVEVKFKINVTATGNLNAMQPDSICENLVIRFDNREAEAEKFGSLEHFRLRNEVMGIELDRTIIPNSTGTHTVVAYYLLTWERPWSRYPYETVADFYKHKEFWVQANFNGIDALIDGGTKSFTEDPTMTFMFDLSYEDKAPDFRFVEGFEELSNMGTTADNQFKFPFPHDAHVYDYQLLSFLEDDTPANGGRQYSESFGLTESEIFLEGPEGKYNYFKDVDLTRLRQHMKWKAASWTSTRTGVFPLLYGREGMLSKQLQVSGLTKAEIRGKRSAALVDGAMQNIYGYTEPA